MQATELTAASRAGEQPEASGVRGEMNNLIFAADGPKPRIDVINNDLKVVGTPDAAWPTTGR
ncbi:MAG TPA: hypothetical protein VGD91_04020 [Trebonia sp.]